MSLTVRPSATMRLASASGSATASRARACPAEICPPASKAARMLGQVGQPKRVGDVTPALADHAGDVAVRIAIIGAELGVAGGLFERVQVCPLHVFDDGDLERFAVAGLDDDDRDLVQPRPLRGPPAALAGDDFVGVRDAGNGADHDGLDNPALLDRGGQFIELVIVEPLSRVARIGAQELDRRLAGAARRRRYAGGFAPPSKAARPRPRRGRFSMRAAASSAMGPSFGVSPVD